MAPWAAWAHAMSAVNRAVTVIVTGSVPVWNAFVVASPAKTAAVWPAGISNAAWRPPVSHWIAGSSLAKSRFSVASVSTPARSTG